ncbi:MAG: hypothetical protein KatS3mg101_0158 [Patescibacteria group bacterium]|nr:MAG: hypothetical protein KatS3mg101_0158 [Patescibacteria group bacterium]
MEKTKGSNIVQLILIALLVGAAFYIGSLSSKVDRLEKMGKEAAKPTNEVAVGAAFDSVSLASSLGIDANSFKTCVDNKETKARVEEEENWGKKAGVSGTPGIIMYDTKTGKSIFIPGAVDLETMQNFMDSLIANKSVKLGNQEFKPEVISDLKSMVDQDYFRGEKTARVQLFEYSDYDCPFCKRVHPTLKSLLENNPGEVVWIYRQFPLTQLHPEARIKSEAALCAGKVGGNDAFWAYSDALLTE